MRNRRSEHLQKRCNWFRRKLLKIDQLTRICGQFNKTLSGINRAPTITEIRGKKSLKWIKYLGYKYISIRVSVLQSLTGCQANSQKPFWCSVWNYDAIKRSFSLCCQLLQRGAKGVPSFKKRGHPKQVFVFSFTTPSLVSPSEDRVRTQEGIRLFDIHVGDDIKSSVKHWRITNFPPAHTGCFSFYFWLTSSNLYFADLYLKCYFNNEGEASICGPDVWFTKGPQCWNDAGENQRVSGT